MRITPYNTKYASFYEDREGQAYFDFTGYDQLEVYLQLMTVGEEGEEGRLVKIEELTKTGADVELVIYGPDSDDRPLEYIKKRVLSYAQNYYWNDAAVQTAQQQQDGSEKYIHLVIPIPDNLKGVSRVALKSTVNTKVHLQVANLFLSKKDGLNPICAGELNPSASAWIEDFDEGDNDRITAKQTKVQENQGKSFKKVLKSGVVFNN